MPSRADYLPTLKKLLEKSEQGRVPWAPDFGGDPGFNLLSNGVPRRFMCELEGGYRFETWASRNGYGVRMLEARPLGGILGMVNHQEVFSVAADEEVVFASPETEQLFNTLHDIYDSARRKALKVDEKLETVSSILDKI